MTKSLAVILNYHSVDDTIRLSRRVASERDRSDIHIDVCIVDATPSNELKRHTEAVSARYFPIANKGYAGGNNESIRARVDEYDSFLVLNPDVELVEREYISKMAEKISKNTEIGILSPLVLDNDGNPFPIPTKTSKILRLIGLLPPLSDSSGAAIRFVDHVPGCCMILSAEMIREIGLLKEDFFLYVENIEYCFRARQAGYRVAIDRSMRVVHDRPSSSLIENKNNQIYYKSRNLFLLADQRYEGVRYGIACAVFLAVVCFQIGILLLNSNYESVRPMSRGLIDGLNGTYGRREAL